MKKVKRESWNRFDWLKLVEALVELFKKLNPVKRK